MPGLSDRISAGILNIPGAPVMAACSWMKHPQQLSPDVLDKGPHGAQSAAKFISSPEERGTAF